MDPQVDGNLVGGSWKNLIQGLPWIAGSDLLQRAKMTLAAQTRKHNTDPSADQYLHLLGKLVHGITGLR